MTLPAVSSADATRRRLAGALSLSVGVAVFTLQDLVMKHLSGDYPVHMAMVIRSFAALPFLLLFVRVECGFAGLRNRMIPFLILRGAIQIVSFTAYYLAFPALPLAVVVALFFTAPLLITALSGPFLGERVGAARWLAVIVGFAGVVLIAGPSDGIFEVVAVLPILSAFGYACGQLIVRRIGAGVVASVTAFYQNLMFMAGGLVLALAVGDGRLAGTGDPSLEFLLRAWTVPSWLDLGLLAVCGPISAISIWLINNAYRTTEANIVAPFEFTAMIWGVVWGAALWGEFPEPLTFAGIALVLGAGLFVMRSRVPGG